MTYILIGFIVILAMHRMNISDSFIIASAILLSSCGIIDKLWDIKIRLSEIKNTIKR